MARPEIGIQRRFEPYTVRPAITGSDGNGYIVWGLTEQKLKAETPEGVLFGCDWGKEESWTNR